jgi:hypothetical protein
VRSIAAYVGLKLSNTLEHACSLQMTFKTRIAMYLRSRWSNRITMIIVIRNIVCSIAGYVGLKLSNTLEHACSLQMTFKTRIAMYLRRKKKYLWFRFPTDPIFFCRPYYFFNAIDRVTLFSPGGCGLLPKWRLLSH